MIDVGKVVTKIQEELIYQGKTLSVAESCTSGSLANSLTRNNGSSQFFKGGLVCYWSEIKEKYLGVKHETIEKYDVVSEEVAKEMLVGCCKMFESDYAIAITGYAGTTQNPNIPSGTIWIAWGNENDIHTLLLTKDSGFKTVNMSNAKSVALSEFQKYLMTKSY